MCRSWAVAGHEAGTGTVRFPNGSAAGVPPGASQGSWGPDSAGRLPGRRQLPLRAWAPAGPQSPRRALALPLRRPACALSPHRLCLSCCPSLMGGPDPGATAQGNGDSFLTAPPGCATWSLSLCAPPLGPLHIPRVCRGPKRRLRQLCLLAGPPCPSGPPAPVPPRTESVRPRPGPHRQAGHRVSPGDGVSPHCCPLTWKGAAGRPGLLSRGPSTLRAGPVRHGHGFLSAVASQSPLHPRPLTTSTCLPSLHQPRFQALSLSRWSVISPSGDVSQGPRGLGVSKASTQGPTAPRGTLRPASPTGSRWEPRPPVPSPDLDFHPVSSCRI